MQRGKPSGRLPRLGFTIPFRQPTAQEERLRRPSSCQSFGNAAEPGHQPGEKQLGGHQHDQQSMLVGPHSIADVVYEERFSLWYWLVVVNPTLVPVKFYMDL